MTDSVTTSIPNATVDYNPPPWDGLHSWLPLVRRLKGAGKSEGTSVLTVHVIVDKDGCAQFWSKPTVCHIEPKSKGGALEALLKALVE